MGRRFHFAQIKRRVHSSRMEILRRQASRAILLTPADEVLLIQIANPDGSWIGWISPGGGLEAGESPDGGLIRELREELDFKPSTEAKPIWRRFHRFVWEKKIYEQTETFFVIRTAKFQPKPALDLSDSERKSFKNFRWWTLPEMAHAPDQFAPRNLHALLLKLTQEGVPSVPFEIGV